MTAPFWPSAWPITVRPVDMEGCSSYAIGFVGVVILVIVLVILGVI